MNVWDASDDALLAITRNVAIDRLRREAVRPSDPVDPMTMSIVDPATGPEDTALTRSDVERVAAALGALPEPQRRCVVLATVGGCTALEISESEHIPLGTAKTRIRDGLIRVRDVLVSEDRSRD
jgi:DNA-directed RNA polymerase specialized sigma24 family protein